MKRRSNLDQTFPKQFNGPSSKDSTRVRTAPVYSQQMADHDGVAMQKSAAPPRGITAVGIFLFFGAAMAGLAGVTLSWPGTGLDRMWNLNLPAYRQLAPLGRGVGFSFLFLSATMAVAGIGWFRRRRWGWRLAAVIIATQVLGDLANIVRGDFLRGGVGFAIAGALLLYLGSARIRAFFATC